MLITRWTNAGLLLMTFVISGCGENVAPPPKLDLVPVSGTVKFGGQPTAGISVMFTPTGATKGQGASVVTDAAANMSCCTPLIKSLVFP